MFWNLFVRPTGESSANHQHPTTASLGDYMVVADEALGIISVFDDLHYDRADADILSPAMRKHAITQLRDIGFHQSSGNVLKQNSSGIRCLIPRAYTLGASPFDITRHTPKHHKDFYILTPTQTASQLINHYTSEDALQRIQALITKQPINLEKLSDYLEQKETHQAFSLFLHQLRQSQRNAVSNQPLNQRRPLGASVTYY